MRVKPNYFVIPLLVAAVAALGSLFNFGSETWMWYDALNQPSLTPPNWIFPIVWNTIYIMAAISIIIVWNKGEKSLRKWKLFQRKKAQDHFQRTISLFAINGILNAAWSLLFFGVQRIDLAFADIILLNITNIALVIMTWKISKPASSLLWLYTGWVLFATFLNLQFLILN